MTARQPINNEAGQLPPPPLLHQWRGRTAGDGMVGMGEDGEDGEEGGSWEIRLEGVFH